MSVLNLLLVLCCATILRDYNSAARSHMSLRCCCSYNKSCNTSPLCDRIILNSKLRTDNRYKALTLRRIHRRLNREHVQHKLATTVVDLVVLDGLVFVSYRETATRVLQRQRQRCASAATRYGRNGRLCIVLSGCNKRFNTDTRPERFQQLLLLCCIILWQKRYVKYTRTTN